MYVLDASALLAYLNDEPGGTEVEALLDDALIATVNLAEVLQRATRNGISATQLATDISGMGVHSVAFDASMAAMSAELWPRTTHRGLSLADRGCLSLGLSAMRSPSQPTRPGSACTCQASTSAS